MWPQKKLINPDVIIENRIFLECCGSFSDGACVRIPVKVSGESMMINATNGLILAQASTATEDYEQEKRHSNAFEMCYDPNSGASDAFRDHFLKLYCEKAANEFIDRLGRR